MSDTPRLWTPGFILLNVQFMLLTCVTAAFFPFQAYLTGLGISQEAAGLIIGADALATLFVQPVVSLRMHPGTAERWLFGGTLVFALALYLEGRLTTFGPLLAARLLQGAGFACIVPALIAMIVESIPAGMSGQAFGWTSLVRLIPYAAVPPLLGWFGVLPEAFGQILRWAALFALLPIAIGLLPCRHGTIAGSSPPGLAGALASLRSPAVILMLIACLALYGGYAAIFFYLQQFGASLRIANSGMFFSVATLTMILVRLLGGPFFDRFDKVRLAAASFVALTLAYALLPLAGSPVCFFALSVPLGLGWGIVMPLQAALMFDLSPAAARGLNQNLLITVMQAGFFAGPASAGVLLAVAGFDGLFLGVALAAGAAALATAALRLIKGKAEHSVCFAVQPWNPEIREERERPDA